MSEQDVDDVAFLTGTNVPGSDCQATIPKKSLYENNGVVVCSQKRALCIATIVFALLFAISLIIAYTGPQSECTCVGEKPPNFVDEDWNVTKMFIPRATNGQIFPWNNVRLPTFIKPLRYNITIHPNITTLDVKGQVSVEFTVEKETQFIVLHSKHLTISEKMIQDRKGHYLKIVRLLEYPNAQQIYIEIKDKFKKKNNYTLHLRYTSKLTKEYEGFYISSYINSDGEKKYLATTHFEPVYARSAFPCFDEPQFKAKFKLSIFRDRFHIALFNMPVINTEDVGFYMGTGLLRDDFEESVEMSTYLVAFVICDYIHINKQTEKGVSVSVYTPPPFISQADFALETATHIMDFFDEFFGVPYPLPKEDLIAIPDFAGSGAMENWGLITYRETAILYDPIETSTTGYQWVAIVVAHELAHQWFGNLVTMKWWNDLWLNEGFASFLEYRGVDSFKPEWRMMEQFILDKTQPALALDALTSSHPISVAVHDPSEIQVIFDTISYSKGASILLMLGNFLQQETLQNGLNDYLTTFKYGNAETKDLWNAFSKHTNQSLEVKNIMDTWTQQMGFPLITLIRNGTTVTATQERFLLTADRGNVSILLEPKSKYDYKWFVPLTYFTDMDNTVINIWMNMSDVTFEIASDVKWIKANINQSGFYRVMYDEVTWASIIEELKINHTVFSAADRASLIDDAFTLCRAGLINASIPLELTLYLKKERDYVPWATALEHFHAWSLRLSESLAYKRFLVYMRQLLEPITQYVGWKDTGSHLDKLMRTEILTTAILFEVNETTAEARAMFDRWMNKNEAIIPDFREVVYSAGIKFGGLKEWQHCWTIYNTTEMPSEKKLLLKALGVSSDPWILQRYLLETLDQNIVKQQDIKIVLGVVASNPEGRLLAWRHLKAYWPTMQEIFNNASFMMGSLISAVTAHLSTPYDYYEVSTYFNGMNVGASTRALEQSLETIKLNINWVQHNEADIYIWLNDYVTNS